MLFSITFASERGKGAPKKVGTEGEREYSKFSVEHVRGRSYRLVSSSSNIPRQRL